MNRHQRRAAATTAQLGTDPDLPRSSRVQVDMAGLTDVGAVRTNNEDQFLLARANRTLTILDTTVPAERLRGEWDEAAHAMMVADGMGGHAAGEVASAIAIGQFLELVAETPDWHMRFEGASSLEVRRRAEERYRRIGEAFTNMARVDASLRGMGTTLTVSCSIGLHLIVAHIGDSRAYLFREEKVVRLTRDHTVAQLLIDKGMLSAEDAAHDPRRHALTDALVAGDKDEVRADVLQVQLADGDCVMLCSDGMIDAVRDDAIAKTLACGGTAAERCRALVDLALAAGGEDNVTVTVATYRVVRE